MTKYDPTKENYISPQEWNKAEIQVRWYAYLESLKQCLKETVQEGDEEHA